MAIWASQYQQWRRKWQPTPVFLPRGSGGQRSLVGCCPQSHTDTTEATQQQQQQHHQILTSLPLGGMGSYFDPQCSKTSCLHSGAIDLYSFQYICALLVWNFISQISFSLPSWFSCPLCLSHWSNTNWSSTHWSNLSLILILSLIFSFVFLPSLVHILGNIFVLFLLQITTYSSWKQLSSSPDSTPLLYRWGT